MTWRGLTEYIFEIQSNICPLLPHILLFKQEQINKKL